MFEFDNLKKQTENLKKEINSLYSNQIYGQDLGSFIFNKMLTRIDPIEYCQRVLRAHLPLKKQKLQIQ
jgi:hypothetical protein